MVSEDYRFCSKEEVDERQRTGEIHVLEATTETADSRLPISSRIIDKARAVKKFVRSGSCDLQKRYLSRTSDQLKATTQYLICDVWNCDRTVRRKPASCVSSTYAFVMDRLLAVRQEITSMSLLSADSLFAVSLLKFMVHFYINSMHVLTSLSAEKPYSSDIDVDAPARNILRSTNSNITSVGSWFDLHLHENALSSCMKSALGLCCHVPFERQNVFRSSRDELSAYLMILSAAQELRKCFHDIYYGGGSCCTNMKQSVRLSTMKELLTHRMALVSNSLNNMRTLHSLDTVLNLDRQHVVHSDMTPETSAKGSLIAHIALKCVRCIRQGNSAGAVRAFLPIASSSLRPHNLNSIDAPMHTAHLRQRLMLGSLLHQLLPELRLLRLMQCDVSVNKNCEMDMTSLRRKLWLCNDSRPNLTASKGKGQIKAVLEAARLLGIPMMAVVTPGTCSSKLTEATCAMLKATPAASSAEPLHVQNISETSTILPRHSDCDAYLRSRALLKCSPIAHADADEWELNPGTSITNSRVEGYSREYNVDCIYSETSKLNHNFGIQKDWPSKPCISAVDVIDTLQESIQDVHCEAWFNCSTLT